MKYTSSEIRTLIYIKNNSCRGLECENCPMSLLVAPCSDRTSKKTATCLKSGSECISYLKSSKEQAKLKLESIMGLREDFII